MDTENPPSWRRLVAWCAGAVLGAGLLYVLASGPAYYWEMKRNHGGPTGSGLFEPVYRFAFDHRWGRPVRIYLTWWYDLATGGKYPAA
jgi:hypothetical protein